MFDMINGLLRTSTHKNLLKFKKISFKNSFPVIPQFVHFNHIKMRKKIFFNSKTFTKTKYFLRKFMKSHPISRCYFRKNFPNKFTAEIQIKSYQYLTISFILCIFFRSNSVYFHIFTYISLVSHNVSTIYSSRTPK